jgi:hypothetical protein
MRFLTRKKQQITRLYLRIFDGYSVNATLMMALKKVISKSRDRRRIMIHK